MNVLGISAFYHDASAALIVDGKIIAAAAEERFTRQKHDPNFPKFAIEHCLRCAELDTADLDKVVFYEEPHTKFTRVLASTLSAYPMSSGVFIRSMKSWIQTKLWLKNEISRRLAINPNKIEYCPHHLSHAFQAFAGSPFKEAAILTVDAIGEWTSTAMFYAKADEALEINSLETISYPHSLGLLYTVFTIFLGFRPNDGESSVMALASFGQPIYLEQVRRILRIHKDGTYEIDQSYLSPFRKQPFTKKFTDLFGSPRNFKNKLPFSVLNERPFNIYPDDQRHADIAASIQCALGEAMLALAGKLHRMTGASNLCLAGGVALNCVTNSLLLKESPFQKLYIPPDPGDGGAAIGAAAYGAFRNHGGQNLFISPYLGFSYDEGPDVAMLKHIDPSNWELYRKSGVSMINGLRLETKKHKDFDHLVSEVVDDLKSGKIIGWFQGRFENGPRALGNRSLLADPSRIEVALRLSRNIKSRSEFRPYAFSVTEEDARRCMHFEDDLPTPAKWMQMVVQVNDEYRKYVRAAIHVDGTSRVQVCTRGENPRFHRLLSKVGEGMGLGALLNTSFNESGYPIVATPAEALLVFARTDLDILVINDVLIRKVSI